MARQKTFFDRLGRHGVCVLLADTLQLEETEGTSPHSFWDGIYFASLADISERNDPSKLRAPGIRHLGGEDYLVPVSTTPDLAQTYTVLLTEDQLRFCLPWDARLANKNPLSIKEALRAHAQSIRPVLALSQDETRHFQELRDRPLGEIAAHAGAFEEGALRLAAPPSALGQEEVKSAEPLLDLPVTAAEIPHLISPFKNLHGMHESSQPHVRAWLQTVQLQIALKVIVAWIERLAEASFEVELMDAILRLREQYERIQAFLGADRRPRQPVARVSVGGFTRSGLSSRAQGTLVIDPSVMLSL